MIELINGTITAGQLRELIKNCADDEPLLIMSENEETGCGYNALAIDFSPALQGEEKIEAIENEEPYEATLYIIG